MSWAEIKKFVNSGDEPINEMLARKDMSNDFTFLSVTTDKASSNVPLDVTGKGVLYCLVSYMNQYIKQTSTLKLTIDDNVYTFKWGGGNGSSGYTGIVIGRPDWIVCDNVGYTSLKIVGGQLSRYDTNPIIPLQSYNATGSYMYGCEVVLKDYIKFNNKLKIEVTNGATTGYNVITRALYSLEE